MIRYATIYIEVVIPRLRSTTADDDDPVYSLHRAI